MHHPTEKDNTYHSLCYTSRGALAGTLAGTRTKNVDYDNNKIIFGL